MEVNVHRTGAAKFDGIVGDAAGDGVVGDEGSSGLGETHGRESSSKGDSTLGGMKSATVFGFSHGGSNSGEDGAGGKDRLSGSGKARGRGDIAEHVDSTNAGASLGFAGKRGVSVDEEDHVRGVVGDRGVGMPGIILEEVVDGLHGTSGGMALLGRKSVDGGGGQRVDTASVIKEGADNLLETEGVSGGGGRTRVVLFGGIDERRAGSISRGLVANGTVRNCGMANDMESLKSFGNIARHGECDGALWRIIVPLEGYANEFRSGKINLESILGAEGGNEVVRICRGTVFDGEVVDNEFKCRGPRVMLENGGNDGVGPITEGGKVKHELFATNPTRLFEAIDGFVEDEQDFTAVISEGFKVVADNDFVGDVFERDLHVLGFREALTEVEVLDVASHELGGRVGNNSIEEELESFDVTSISLGVAAVIGEIATIGITHAKFARAVRFALLFDLGGKITELAIGGPVGTAAVTDAFGAFGAEALPFFEASLEPRGSIGALKSARECERLASLVKIGSEVGVSAMDKGIVGRNDRGCRGRVLGEKSARN